MRQIIIFGILIALLICCCIVSVARSEIVLDLDTKDVEWVSMKIELKGDSLEHLIPQIIRVESSWNAGALGESGEVGLCQISSIVLAEFNKNYAGECEGWASVWNEGTYIQQCDLQGNLFGEKYYKFKRIDLYDEEINILIGTWYLNRLKDHYIPKDKYSDELLLACWNYGVGNMRELNWNWKKAPRQVRAYIRKVLK